NNNYSASKKGKSNGNHDNDNQGHAIDNSESGKQAERNAVQESASTGAYGMAVDDDALNKGNINDEGAMRKAKKAEYNKRAREKKRQAILDKANEELAMEKTKKAAYNKRAREKKREALLEEVDKSKKAEYNKRAYGKKRHAIVDTVDEEVAMKRSKKAEDNKRAREKKRQAILDKANEELAMEKTKKAAYNKRAREKKREALLEEVDKSKKAEYNKRAYGKKRHAIVDTVDEEVAMKRSKKAEDNKRAREKKRNSEVGNQGRGASILHHMDMDQSNEEESKEGEDGIHYHAQSDHHLKLLAAQEQEDHERRVDNRRIYALQPNRMNEGGQEETKEEIISDGNADCNNDNQLLALANADPPLNMDVNLVDVPPLSLRNKPKGRPKKKSTHNSGDDFDESLVPLHIIAQRSICPHCEAKIWPGEEKDCCDSGAR
ncbi:unnamed protein product, partial [Aphanomyces euteiches]